MRGYQFYLGLIGFIVLSVASFFLVNYLVPSEQERKPASIPKQKYFDFSKLEGEQLEQAVRKHILRQSSSLVRDGSIGIQLGHFIIKGLSGVPMPACDVYDLVSVEFEAEGMATSGDRPHLVVTGSCRATENQAFTRPLWIPVEKIQHESPNDLELSFNDDGPVTVRVEHIGFEWPQHWVLSGIRFSTKNEESVLSIDRRQVYELSQTPLVMTWTMKR